MLCKKPFIKDAIPYGCGQCFGCRINKRREWTNRIMLESMAHEHSAFVTLTIAPEHYNGTLEVKHIQDWQKLLRYHAGYPLRFFTVGEYGDQTKRGHYHAAVFGLEGCASQNLQCPCAPCTTLRASWKKGFVSNGTLTKDSASYIAGYVTKKLTDRKPEEKYEKLLKKGEKAAAEEYKKRVIDELDGKLPEFARMSLNPGIGAGPKEYKGDPGKVIRVLRDLLWTEHGNQELAELNDIPDIIKIAGREVCIGRYLKNKLRKEFSIGEKTKEQKMQILQQEKIEEYLAYREEKKPGEKTLSQKEFLLEKHIQKRRNLEARYQGYKTKPKGVI